MRLSTGTGWLELLPEDTGRLSACVMKRVEGLPATLADLSGALEDAVKRGDSMAWTSAAPTQRELAESPQDTGGSGGLCRREQPHSSHPRNEKL